MNTRKIITIILLITVVGTAIVAYIYFHKKQSENAVGFISADLAQDLQKRAVHSPIISRPALKGKISSAAGRTGKLIIGQDMFETSVSDGKFSLNIIPPGFYPVVFVDNKEKVHTTEPGGLRIYPGDNYYDLELKD